MSSLLSRIEAMKWLHAQYPGLSVAANNGENVLHQLLKRKNFARGDLERHGNVMEAAIWVAERCPQPSLQRKRRMPSTNHDDPLDGFLPSPSTSLLLRILSWLERECSCTLLARASLL